MNYEDAVALAEHWITAWNAHDLDGILSHYAPNVVFEANTVRTRWGKDDGKLHGIEELRKHFALGLQLVPDLRFQLDQVFLAPCGYAVVYTRENGNRVIDCVKLNPAGLAEHVTAYYGGAQA